MGRLMQNDYIESSNGKFRDECLNELRFISAAITGAASETAQL